MSCVAAAAHVPQVPTLAFRIRSSHHDQLPPIRLRRSPHYTICRYVFDDQDVDILQRWDPSVTPEELGKRHRLFDGEIAERMLRDFERLRTGNLELLVHCTLGASRSPAVAMALNEIFGLGEDQQALLDRYGRSYNQYVYRVLQETAEKHGYGKH